ncbi:YaaA family protein [Collinsella tanakaei]|nr:YaaA family protein [Collinsella tanakaei]
MLQVIISPAKQMRVAADTFTPRGIPPFPERTERLVRELRDIERTQGAEGLKRLWRVNDKLLAENIERLHEFEPVSHEEALDDPAVARTISPAIFSYIGIQYRSMAPEVMGFPELEWLQAHLWVLSGLYGCVRPFDAVQPYRLEMGAKLSVDDTRDLYAFWGDRLAQVICADGPTCVVNLASVEYAKAALPHLPAGSQAVTCIFGEDLRAGKPVQRATASKIARGSMVRWMAENGIERAEELTRFDIGYAHAPELSSEDGRTLVFMKRA